MTRRVELFSLVIADALALMGANYLWYVARFDWGWFSEPVNIPVPSAVWIAVLALSFGGLVVLLFFGMYRERYASSRFDELVSLAKVITIGILAMFFFLFIDQLDAYSARKNLLFYWLAVFGLLAFGRFIVRSVQKRLILGGKGLHRTLVVGWDDRLEQLYRDVARYPEAGLDIVGAIRLQSDLQGSEPADSHISELPRLIEELAVQDVLIALGPGDREPLIEILQLCDGTPVRLKLVPDFYSVIGGMARTEHMYGLPLIEVMPEPMPAWEESSKRLLDLVVSSVVLVLGTPIWVAVGLLVRLSSSGPAIYSQKRVGRLGREFSMFKFRTMVENAEAKTGPVWAQEDDPRYTGVGRWLRKTRVDEVPQFWNVFKGEMSLVGPRPERPYFVEKLAAEIPLYNRRHRVKPGITGWAQVKWKYDSSVDDVKQKVKYDLFYIENLSLRRDLQILFRTITTALRGSGQ